MVNNFCEHRELRRNLKNIFLLRVFPMTNVLKSVVCQVLYWSEFVQVVFSLHIHVFFLMSTTCLYDDMFHRCHVTNVSNFTFGAHVVCC